MNQQRTIWQMCLRALQSVRRSSFGRHDQRAAFLLLLLLLLGGEPLSCMLHCRFVSVSAASPAETYGLHHAVTISSQATDTFFSPIAASGWFVGHHPGAEDSQPSPLSTVQEHEHVAALFLLPTLIVIGERLFLRRCPACRPLTLNTPPGRPPPVLAFCLVHA